MASLRQPDEGIGSRLKDSERAIALFRRHKLAESGTRGNRPGRCDNSHAQPIVPELLQECSGLFES
jgi:hypothetical protein